MARHAPQKFKARAPSGKVLIMRELGADEIQEIGVSVARQTVAKDGDTIEHLSSERRELTIRSLVRYGDLQVSDDTLGDELYHAMPPKDLAAAEAMYRRLHQLTDEEEAVFFGTMEPVKEGSQNKT